MNSALRYSNNMKYYRVSIHKSGKYRYASTQPTIVDEETGKKRSYHVHWGTLDDRLRFYPNKNYLNASEEVRRHLIFPDEWDLTLLEKLEMNSEIEQHMRYEKKTNAILDNYSVTRKESVEADQIYRLIHSLRETNLSSDAILDAVLSMENPA